MASTLTQGLLKIPGPDDYEAKRTMERLLAEDREKHHCFYNIGFHNHLPHHLFAVYDMGASPKLLQAVYDAEVERQDPINLVDRGSHKVGPPEVTITRENWTEHIGFEKYYAAYLPFFKSEVERLSISKCIEEYVFSPKANGNGAEMLLRFVGQAFHPIIQVGCGAEFNDPSIVASGLAETAVSRGNPSRIHDDSLPDFSAISPNTPTPALPNHARRPKYGPSLFEILKEVYQSDIMKPVMPYDPDALIRKRFADVLASERPEEIRRLASLWLVDPNGSEQDFADRAEELLWLAALLVGATGREGRKPRVDFFLMHVLTASLFVPSLVKVLENPASKARVVRALLPPILYFLTIRGRPRVNPGLGMSYTAYPRPPVGGPNPDDSVVGDPRDPEMTNPWPAIITEGLHAPDAHVAKSVRSLYYAAVHYGSTPPGGAIGAFDANGEETLPGLKELDGTIFVRTAGVLIDALGWVTHGQKEGDWDRSGLGWDEAWEVIPDKVKDFEFEVKHDTKRRQV